MITGITRGVVEVALTETGVALTGKEEGEMIPLVEMMVDSVDLTKTGTMIKKMTTIMKKMDSVIDQ